MGERSTVCGNGEGNSNVYFQTVFQRLKKTDKQIVGTHSFRFINGKLSRAVGNKIS